MRSVLVTIVLGLLLTSQVQGRRQKPLKEEKYPGDPKFICDDCVPRELILAPGIGLDLAPSYGTVAIRYHNRTVVDVGRIEGYEKYTRLIQKWKPPFVPYGPPFNTVLDRIKWDLEQASRRWRKLRGLPSTTDIDTLADFLLRLRFFATTSLMMPVNRVAISLPDIPNLRHEDWVEATERAGLDVLRSYKTGVLAPPLENVNAAWAGMGYGLCEHWRDIEQCEEEEQLIEPKFALELSFTGTELTIDKTYIPNAHRAFRLVSNSYTDLGYDTWMNNTRNGTFWGSIREKVVDVATRIPEYPIEGLILMGEYAEEKKFLDAVWEALVDVADVQKLWAPLQVSGFSAEFVAARGAAELAKRWQGETWNCVEGDWCDGGSEDEGRKDEI